MHEMTDFAELDDPEIEPRSSPVSFADRYLISYIRMCKQSKRVTCGCSIMFVCLAVFCFFATNYIINYPVTKDRKIGFVYAGVFCLIAAVSCLELRFRIIQQCRGETDDDSVLFEIARRDIEFSDSFSGHFEMQEMSFPHGTPEEGPSQTEKLGDASSLAHTDPCVADIATFRYNGHAGLPRHSISGGMTSDTPLLPQRRPLELSRPSGMENGMDSRRLRNGGIVSDNGDYPPNYSTFQNGCKDPGTEPLVAKPTFENENGCDTFEN